MRRIDCHLSALAHSHGGYEDVKGSRLLLLLAAGILAQPGKLREQDVQQEFQTALGLVDHGRIDEAALAFRTIVAHHPELSEAWNNLASIEASRGDLEGARVSLRKALECRQASQITLRNLDRVLGRMAREAWDSALSASTTPEAGPQLDLVRSLVALQDSTRKQRESDSLRFSIRRLSQERDSLQSIRLTQGTALDSIRATLQKRQVALDQLTKKESQDRIQQEELRKAFQALVLRSDSVHTQMIQRGEETEKLRLQLARRTREADSLRAALARREAEGDSLRRTLARVEREKNEARQELSRRNSEVARLRSETDGKRVASAGVVDLRPTATTSEAPMTTIQAWAAAWSRKDVSTYLGFYSEEFAPSEGRAAWEALRRQRLNISDSIEIELVEPKIRKLPSGNVEVVFRQRYRAGTTHLTTRKKIELRREVPGWKILREESAAR